jgi:hypothetical protein
VTKRHHRRIAADGDGAHDVAVLLAEQGHRSGGDGLFLAHVGDVDRLVGQHRLVDGALDPAERLAVDGAVVGEVEAQPVGGDQRPGLHDVVAQVGAQLAVQQVGSRMVAADVGAALAIHFQMDDLAFLELAAGHFADVDDQPGHGAAHIAHLHLVPPKALRTWPVSLTSPPAST